MKLWLKIVMGGLILLLGAVVYDSISQANIDLSDARAIADRIRAERDGYKIRLDEAAGRISELETVIRDVEKASDSLKHELDRSRHFTNNLKQDNIRLAKQLESSRAEAEFIRDANTRLGEELNRSRELGGSIDQTNKGIEESIIQVESIIERYPRSARDE